MRPVGPVWPHTSLILTRSSGDSERSDLYLHVSQENSSLFSELLIRPAVGGFFFFFIQTHISEEGIKLTKMPASFCGSWEIISNVNFEGYMIALGKSLKHVVLTQQCSQILHLC